MSEDDEDETESDLGNEKFDVKSEVKPKNIQVSLQERFSHNIKNIYQ